MSAQEEFSLYAKSWSRNNFKCEGWSPSLVFKVREDFSSEIQWAGIHSQRRECFIESRKDLNILRKGEEKVEFYVKRSLKVHLPLKVRIEVQNQRKLINTCGNKMMWNQRELYDRRVILHVHLEQRLKQRHYFAGKGPSSKSCGFSSSLVWMWELDHKESWAPKNWSFWTLVVGMTLESPLDCRIKPVNLKEISPEYSLEGLMPKLKCQYFGYYSQMLQGTNSLKRTMQIVERSLSCQQAQGKVFSWDPDQFLWKPYIP